jgi:hypothetical protein
LKPRIDHKSKETTVSLTQGEHVFAGVHENGINDFLQAFFTARPRYLNYGTALFVPATTAGATNVPTIAFPGVPGGLQYLVTIGIPFIDLHPNSLGGADPIPPNNPGQFTMRTKVRLTVGCGHWEDRPPNRDRPPDVKFTPLSTTLEVWVRGHLTVTTFGPGLGEVSFVPDDVEIVDIKPDSLEAVLECLLRMILQAVLANVRLPFHALSMGAFSLILTRGPEVDHDQVKLFGKV